MAGAGQELALQCQSAVEALASPSLLAAFHGVRASLAYLDTLRRPEDREIEGIEGLKFVQNGRDAFGQASLIQGLRLHYKTLQKEDLPRLERHIRRRTCSRVGSRGEVGEGEQEGVCVFHQLGF